MVSNFRAERGEDGVQSLAGKGIGSPVVGGASSGIEGWKLSYQWKKKFGAWNYKRKQFSNGMGLYA